LFFLQKPSKMSGDTNKIAASVITLLVISVLIITGSANAFVLDFLVSNNFPLPGAPITFMVSAEIEHDEILNIEKFTLALTGPQNSTCEFFPNGTILNSCPGIQVNQIESTEFQYDYGYGYGFLPGFLKYNITLDSSILPPGEYTAKLFAETPTEQFQSSEQKIIIFQELEPIEKCSIRAQGGDILVDGKSLISPRTKLNLGVQESRAQKGQGFITAQGGRERISYQFTIDKAVKVSANTILFYTSGFLEHNKKKTSESAIISFNMDSFEADVGGELLEIKNMDVNFARC